MLCVIVLKYSEDVIGCILLTMSCDESVFLLSMLGRSTGIMMLLGILQERLALTDRGVGV